MDSEVQADTGTAAEDTAAAVTDGGQGQGGTTEGLYDEVLTSAPEELRPQLQEYLKKVDGNVTRKFQEYAEKLKGYEAFEGIDGLADVPAEDLQGLLDFRNLAADPEQFESWWEQVGVEMGFLDGEGAEDDGLDVAGVDDETAPPAWAQPLIEDYQQRQERETTERAQSDQAERVKAARESLEPRLAEVTEKHSLTDKAQAAVLRFARDHVETDDDPIGRGLEDYLQLTGDAQSELVEDRLNQPDAATSGGRPVAGGERPKTFAEARAAGKARMGVGA